jgi:hypothetical protein
VKRSDILLTIRFFNKLLKKFFSALGCHSCGSSLAFGGMDSHFCETGGGLEVFRILLRLLQNSSRQGEIVIPGKRSPAPHGIQGEARLGIQDFQAILDSGFRRNDGVSAFCENLCE